MKKKDNPLKIKYIRKVDVIFLALVFFMFLVLIIAVSIGTTAFKKKQLLLLRDTMDNFAQNQKIQFEKYIDDKVDVLKGLASYEQIYGMNEDEQNMFIKGHSQQFGFQDIFVMRADGSCFYIEEAVHRDRSEETFYFDAMSHDVFVTEPLYSNGSTIMTICVSITDNEGKKTGALCGAVELGELQNIFEKSKMILDGDIFIINRSGYYVSASDMQLVYSSVSAFKEENADFSLVKEAISDKKDCIGTIIKGGDEYQAMVTYLENFDWVIVQCTKTEDIFKDLRYIEYFRVVATIVLVFLVLCVVRIAIYWNKSQEKIMTDALTGSLSRVAMHNIQDWLDKEKQYDAVVVFMDLNKFKYINDTFGHEKGDEILCTFADVLKKTFGSCGSVGRIGGDEFMIIMLNKTESEALELCSLANEMLKNRGGSIGIDVTVSASYGCAVRKAGSEDSMGSIVAKADEFMYFQKRNQKNEQLT